MSAYAPDRKAERPKAHLLGFSSILQVDGFAGYRDIGRRNDVPRGRPGRDGQQNRRSDHQPHCQNALFAGSDDGGDNWAIIASLIETAKLSRVDPLAWLTDTLERLARGHSSQGLDQAMPWNLHA